MSSHMINYSLLKKERNLCSLIEGATEELYSALKSIGHKHKLSCNFNTTYFTFHILPADYNRKITVDLLHTIEDEVTKVVEEICNKYNLKYKDNLYYCEKDKFLVQYWFHTHNEALVISAYEVLNVNNCVVRFNPPKEEFNPVFRCLVDA